MASSLPRSKTRPDASLVNVRETEVSSELRAAAAARALSFYTYPADRSEFSVRAHRNMRIDAEWDAIRAKIAGTDVAFRRSRVTCLVATLDLDQDVQRPTRHLTHPVTFGQASVDSSGRRPCGGRWCVRACLPSSERGQMPSTHERCTCLCQNKLQP